MVGSKVIDLFSWYFGHGGGTTCMDIIGME
jgi:hypothetical protein